MADIISDNRVQQEADTSGGAPGLGDILFPYDSVAGKGIATWGHEPFDTLATYDAIYFAENFDDIETPTDGEWEIGRALVAWVTDHYELDRSGTTPYESSNAGALVNWDATELSGDVATLRVTNVQNPHELTPLDPTNNLSDIVSAPTARTNLGLGNVAVATMGSGNGLDADKVDGREAAAFWEKTVTATLSGDNSHSGDNTFSGTNTFTGDNDYGAGAGGRIEAPSGTDQWPT